MRAALILLTLTYILSQFFRAFLAVLAPELQAQLGVTEAQLSSASGAWFLVFALAQLPIGWALDNIGPRVTTSVLVVLCAGGGAFVFAMAQTPAHLVIAMGLIGLGCAPMLMASFFLIARNFSAVVFSTYAGIVIAVGNLGNIGASRPLAMMLELVGWRMTMTSLGAVTVGFGLLIWVIVRDPPKLTGDVKGSILDLLKIPALWLIFPLMFINYAPAAAIRGLWIGPYLDQVLNATTAQIGNVTLLMGVAMAVGSLAFGPMDRIFKTRKWVVASAALASSIFCFALVFWAQGLWVTAAVAAIVGASGTAFPLIVAHTKAFVPAHLTGRGVTLINMFGIGGVGVMQTISGRVFNWAQVDAATAAAPFHAVFLFFGISAIIGVSFYVFVQDRLD